MPPADNYHWWFSLIIYPRYVNKLTDVRKLYEIETFKTSKIMNENMPKFYYYIVAAEMAEKPYTVPPSVTTSKFSLHFNEDAVG